MLRAVMPCLLVALSSQGNAQVFEKKSFHHNEWTKGRFSEAVTITGPAKLIFLARVVTTGA